MTDTYLDIQSHKTILAIDDNERYLKILSEILMENGYSVLLAKNKDEGMDLYNKDPKSISMVIVDWQLDEFDSNNNDGIDIALEVKKKSPFTPVICVSAHHSSREMKDYGLFDYYFEKGSRNPDSKIEKSIPHINKSVNEFCSNLISLLPLQIIHVFEKYEVSLEDRLDVAKAFYFENSSWRKKVTIATRKSTSIFSELSIFRSFKWKIEYKSGEQN